MTDSKASTADDVGHSRVGNIIDTGAERRLRRSSAAKQNDPNVTFEEYFYYAQLSRAHPSEAPGSSTSDTVSPVSRYNPFKKHESSGDKYPTVDEKTNNGSPIAETWHNVSDEDYVQASRALRTATWGAVFYLITTDILGPFTTAWVGFPASNPAHLTL